MSCHGIYAVGRCTSLSGLKPKKNPDIFSKGTIILHLYWKTIYMPYTKIMVHLVWCTKNRAPLLSNEIRPAVLDHFRCNAIQKGIFIESVNGLPDHVHCLVSLGIDQNISKIVGLIKGESSHWINQEKLVKGKFAWQDEYFAVSVSESGIRKVEDYIRNQEAHHRKKSFQDEYDEFFRIYGFSRLV
jgi:REP element-mobilizing transposase RayT